VTIQSIGGAKGRAKGDLSGLNYKVIKVNNVSLREKFLRKKFPNEKTILDDNSW
jgi:ribosomal protein S12